MRIGKSITFILSIISSSVILKYFADIAEHRNALNGLRIELRSITAEIGIFQFCSKKLNYDY